MVSRLLWKWTSVRAPGGAGRSSACTATPSRALAVTSAKRNPGTPSIPTIAESYPGFESGTWFALLAPAHTPREIVDRLNAAVAKVVQTPDVREKIVAQGGVPMGGSPQQVGVYIKSEVAKWGKVVRASGAKVE
ncbi:MAG TPA: tripartite tricarboxylate transporter substrate-binding protein [Polyangiaceae bacterium]|nr:tripartite tricarboxylate transporter substrate-binding protein [Polyangiaceae bacterium]